MKARLVMKMVLAAAPVMVAPKPAASQLLFDDFSTGLYQKSLKSGSDNNFQSGAMIGGNRETTFSVCTPPSTPCKTYNPWGQPSSFQVRGKTSATPSALVYNGGYKVFSDLGLGYGFPTPLSLNLSSTYDRLRVSFDGIDQTLNFNIIVFSTGGSLHSQIGCNLVDPGNGTAFTVDFPFADFTPGGGTPGADFSNVTQMVLEFGVAEDFPFGEDFAVTSFQAIPTGAPAADITCTGLSGLPGTNGKSTRRE